MSDSGKEEDSLISQGDIDKLLDSSSIEEAEGQLSSDESDSGEEFGELSQDDIDKMMNANVLDSGDDPIDDDDDDDMELISQDDIDALMNSNASDSEDDEKPKDSQGEDLEEAEPEDDLGDLSQDDIDKMMNTDSEDDLLSIDDDQELEMISQDDISSLINENTEDIEAEKEPSAKREDETSFDNIKPVEEEKKSEDNIEESTESSSQDNSREDDFLIEESEAVDVQECLVTQETIDDLINTFGEKPESEPSSTEPVILDEESASDSEEQIEQEAQQVALSGDGEDDTSENTTSENLLKPESNATVLDLEEGDEDVAQEEIDALLLDDDDEGEDDLLISQDDIDTLLMAADQEDEDVLGNLMDDDSDHVIEDEDYEGDILEKDEDTKEEYEDQVVLEGDDSEEEADTESKNRWYKSKLIIACASILIAMGIVVPAVYFFFSQGDSSQTRDTTEQYAVEGSREIEIETVDIHVKAKGDINKAGKMVLKNFVILASDLSKEMAYITTDVSIDYSDQRAYHEIQNNLSFYRDLIYDSINKSLASGKRDQITAADILWRVEKTLKKVLPGTYIDRVSFQSFKAS